MSIRPLSFKELSPPAIAEREIAVDEADFAALSPAGSTLSDFLSSLPNLGLAREMFFVRDAMVSAIRHKRNIVFGCGGHVVASGLGPLLARAIEQRMVTAIAMTGDALLQDVEVALSGHTVLRRDNDAGAGVFGVTAEAGQLINNAINVGALENQGIGKAVASALIDSQAPFSQHSILAAAGRMGITVTVHPAIGVDAFNIHPASKGESLGACGLRDFKTLAAVMGLSNQGVLVNVASSTMLPRVFVQAVDVARKTGKHVEGLTTVMIGERQSSSSSQDIIAKLAGEEGQGHALTGPEELLVPLLFAAVQDVLNEEEKR